MAAKQIQKDQAYKKSRRLKCSERSTHERLRILLAALAAWPVFSIYGFVVHGLLIAKDILCIRSIGQ